MSKSTIVVWVPATLKHNVRVPFRRNMEAVFGVGTCSFTSLRYPATWDIGPSAATGIEALRMLLLELHRRAPGKRLLLAGESQGAMVAGEALADPAVRRVVARAVLLGHPWVATHHYHDARDIGVVEIDNPADPIAQPVHGMTAAEAIHEISTMMAGTASKADAVRAVLHLCVKDPVLLMRLVLLLGAASGWAPSSFLDWHMYDKFELEAAKVLAAAPPPAPTGVPDDLHADPPAYDPHETRYPVDSD